MDTKVAVDMALRWYVTDHPKRIGAVGKTRMDNNKGKKDDGGGVPISETPYVGEGEQGSNADQVMGEFVNLYVVDDCARRNFSVIAIHCKLVKLIYINFAKVLKKCAKVQIYQQHNCKC